jgi:hypothetical protein
MVEPPVSRVDKIHPSARPARARRPSDARTGGFADQLSVVPAPDLTTARPLYEPQLGQTRWGTMGAEQLGQGTTFGALTLS